MAKETKLLVVVKTDDVERLMGRIEALKGVEEVEERDEVDCDENLIAGWPNYDMLVKCGHGVRRSDIEELLLGVDGVEVRLIK